MTATKYFDFIGKGVSALSSSRDPADETSGLGAPVAGQTGTAASITTVSSGVATITGLTGMSATLSPGRILIVSNAASGGNNGSFEIQSVLSATSVTAYRNGSVASDANNGSIHWTERAPFTVVDNLECSYADRTAIKVSIANIVNGTTTVGNATYATTAGFTTMAGDVTKIRGYAVQNAAPSDGQVLQWVQANNRYEPKTISTTPTSATALSFFMAGW